MGQGERRPVLAGAHRELRRFVGYRSGVDDLPADLHPLASGRRRKINHVEPTGDRLPAGRAQVDLLEDRRRQLPVDTPNGFLELIEARSKATDLLLQGGAAGLLLAQQSIKISTGSETPQSLRAMMSCYSTRDVASGPRHLGGPGIRFDRRGGVGLRDGVLG